MQSFIRRQWFLFVLLGVVLLGYMYPVPGAYIKKNLSIKWFIMPTLFLMSLSLKTGAIFRSFLNVRGVVSAVLGGYFLTTLSLYILGHALFPQQRDLVIGLIACGATPCTLASAAIWTRLAGGNDALALALTIVSNLTSFIFTPTILLVTLGSAVSPPFADIMAKLLVVIVVPVVLGQILRIWLAAQADRWKVVISVICRLLILVVVLVSVSHATHTAGQMSEAAGLTTLTFGLLIVAVAVAHVVALVGCGLIAWAMRASVKDIGAVIFCGSQKTLPVGIYIATTIAEAQPADAFVFITLPILIYHATQLTIDSFIIGPYRKHIIGEDEAND